jgi:ATP-dependent helicase/nuclease subunit A
MGVSWTEEQLKVIHLRNRNILVSAAAGSGKTAVLVERIITMITDPEHPVDIDHLLVVTFTNAAASEMRERIGDAINKKLEEDADNMHLQRQSTLIHNAQITTIHSFCLYVIRNHFHTIGLDPGFRIGDEGELKLLKSDVIEELLEEYYEKKEESFFHFIESYATGKNDKGIEELILKLYHSAMSYPWPKQWLEECRDVYEATDLEALNNTAFMKILLDNLQLYMEDLEKEADGLLSIALSQEGPYMYEDALQSDKMMLNQLKNCKTYEEYARAFSDLKFARLSSKKDPAVSQQKKENVKTVRDDMKKTLSKLKEQYFYTSAQQILEDQQYSGRAMEVLIQLTIDFIERFQEKKSQKNLVDFNDLEHLALDILVKLEDDEILPTEAAQEFGEFFEEVLVDEYQDSNLVQETILRSISKEYQNRKNLFMVGDVKQSIYRFRLARPELFMEKYENYSLTESDCQRIDLHKNFRSRRQVLDGVNFIFDQIMAKYLGNIEYNEETALYAGVVFPEGNRRDFQKTEVLVIETDSEMVERERLEETARELEAKAIGKRIEEIVGNEVVIDKAAGQYRKARYSDIVILLRTITGWADTFAKVLSGMGIPAYSTSSTGYFSTLEIQTILSMLHVIDNPKQDIPLAAVLKSPIVGLTGEELAVIRSTFPKENFYQSCFHYAKDGTVKELRNKLEGFLKQLDGFRRKVAFTPMHELLWDILEQTGYGDYLSAMPQGAQRKANAEMLVEKAIAYEATSYRGLFNFIRYIEHLQKYNVDFGEAGTIGENEDTVRIMSIHKSKGLEFPIVFAAGMGKTFNSQDSREKIVVHPELYIGTDCIHPKSRTKAPTLLKRVIQKQIALENLGEELRVLYVALTRAKEKLILTGTTVKLKDKLLKWCGIQEQEELKLSFHLLSGASTYWDFILPALIRHRSMNRVLKAYEIQRGNSGKLYNADAEYDIQVISLMDLVEEEVLEQMLGTVEADKLKQWDSKTIYAKEIREQLNIRFKEVYPFQHDRDIVTKITVSDLKRKHQQVDDEYSQRLYEEQEAVSVIPEFIQAQGEVTNAARGTAYHRVLQFLDLTAVMNKKTLTESLKSMVEERKLTAEMAQVIYVPAILSFMKSDLAKRMTKAEKEGYLHREQQFVLGVDAPEVDEKWSHGEMVLVQGIIDAFFYEDDEIILVDYKTDYAKAGDEKKLVEKYKVQLDYYAKALQRITGKKIREKIIYSFSLQKEIII